MPKTPSDSRAQQAGGPSLVSKRCMTVNMYGIATVGPMVSYMRRVDIL